MRVTALLAAIAVLAGCSSESGTTDATYVDAGGSQTNLDATVGTDAHPTEDAAPEAAQDVLTSPDANEASTVDATVMPPVCAPGKQEYCACVGGKPGAQVCKSDGSGWSECECPEEPDAGPKDSGADVDAGGDANLLECANNQCQPTYTCYTPGGIKVALNGCCTDNWDCGAIASSAGVGSYYCTQIDQLTSLGVKCN